MINIENLMEKSAAEKIKSAGLHRIVAAMEKVASGRDIGSEMTLPMAVMLLAEKSFIKSAEDRRIAAGLIAMKKLNEK